MLRGQLLIASSATVIIVGKAIMAKTMLPASPDSPTGRLNVFCRNGTIIVRPKKPYTTDGMPFSSSIMGFNALRTLKWATSAMYIDTASPKGRAINIAKKLTHSVPLISGRIPNIGDGVAVGNHSLPPSTSLTEMLLSGIILTSGWSFTSTSGTKAIIPGVLCICSAIFLPACSYSAPSSFSE